MKVRRTMLVYLVTEHEIQLKISYNHDVDCELLVPSYCYEKIVGLNPNE